MAFCSGAGGGGSGFHGKGVDFIAAKVCSRAGDVPAFLDAVAEAVADLFEPVTELCCGGNPCLSNSVAHESETRNVKVRGIELFTREFDDFISSLSSSQPVPIRAP
jgi:hypothetical protein